MLDRIALYKGWWSYWTMMPSIKFCPMARIHMHPVHQKPLPGVIAPSVGYRPSSKVIRTEVTKMSGIYEYLSLVWVDLNYYRWIDSNLYKAATTTAENTWMTWKYFLLFSKISQGAFHFLCCTTPQPHQCTLQLAQVRNRLHSIAHMDCSWTCSG